MKKRIIIALTLLSSEIAFSQTSFVANYDESKVGSYTLPNPLQKPDGSLVKTQLEWKKQRTYLLKLLADNEYGILPTAKIPISYKILEINKDALNGKGIRKRIELNFANKYTAEMVLYIPKNVAKPAVFVGLNFCGNHCVTAETDVPIPTKWMIDFKDGTVVNNRATEKGRADQASRWQLDYLISQGFAVATAYYGDFEPDHPEGWKEGIRGTLANELSIKSEQWSAIGAWAWGLSRMMDYLQTEALVNAKKVIITGHSRLGKGALWAAANDERFAAVISNNSGEGGTALARRNYGETVGRITSSFPHWFIPKFSTYASNPNQLPTDQHTLLSLMAPRPLYVASAEEDRWADPKGEFLGAFHAQPVYALFKKEGLGVTELPAVNQPVGKTIRYHVRTGGHDITAYDWEQYVKFAKEL
jgi:hypothetical protein